MINPPQVLLISGSVREPSYTRELTEAVERSLAEKGATTIHWNPGRQPLPIADPRFHGDPSQHDDPRVRDLVSAATDADGFVLASPIYHNSYSGVLKNTLDHLAIAQFHWKPVGLISHGGNRSPQAVDHLRIVVRGLLGVAIPTQVCTAVEDYLDKVGKIRISHPAILQRIERLTMELTAFAIQMAVLRKPR